jgi:glycerate kinase
VISQTVLVALEAFEGDLDAARGAAAVGRGLCVGEAMLEVDLCPLDGIGDAHAHEPSAIATRLAELDFDTRMRAARAVVVGAGRLDEATLLGSATFEVATRARQAGVPAYAVTAVNALSPFDARILDLQVVLQARDVRGLRRAGEQLAEIV